MKLYETITESKNYYQFTSRWTLAAIKHNGIIPQNPTGNWKNIKYNKITFLTTKLDTEVINELLGMFSNKHHTANDHEQWSDADWKTFENSYVVLTIDGDKVPNLNIIQDTNAPKWWHSVATTSIIPPQAIIDVQDIKFDWSDDI